MDEYIKLEALKDFPIRKDRCDKERANEHFIFGIETVLEYAENLPAADVAPVVHGQWEWFDEDTGTPITGYEREWGWRCTHCKEELPDDYDDPDCQPKFKYCHNCGAKMDGDSNAAD